MSTRATIGGGLTVIMHLPPGKAPRDQTLRKLYFSTKSDAAAIDDCIAQLRAHKVTLVWDKEPADGRAIRRPSFAELLSKT